VLLGSTRGMGATFPVRKLQDERACPFCLGPKKKKKKASTKGRGRGNLREKKVTLRGGGGAGVRGRAIKFFWAVAGGWEKKKKLNFSKTNRMQQSGKD